MDYHKSLYKDRSYNSRSNNKINRELLEANRCKQRRERFQSTRNISPSPVRHQKELIIPLCPEREENVNDSKIEQKIVNTTRLAKIVCNATNPDKLTKQAAFIQRFVEWKENKKNMKKQDMDKKKPFLSAVNCGRQAVLSNSLVPKGHHKGFCPPTGLKNPIDNEKADEIKNHVVKGRQSVYTVVPTPTKKMPQEKLTNKLPIARKALTENLQTNILVCNKTPQSSANLKKVTNKSIAEIKLTNVKKPANKSSAKVAADNLANMSEKERTITKVSSTKPLLRRDLRPRALKMPPPPPPPSLPKMTSTSKNSQSGAIAKIRTMTQTRTENVKHNKKSPLKHGGARLAQNLKAKKPLNTSKKAKGSYLNVDNKKVLTLLKNNELIEDMVIQTPRDFAFTNPFNEFVTSTRIKDSSQVTENEKEKKSTEKSQNNSAKRNIMKDPINGMFLKQSNQKVEEKPNEENQHSFKKYNFIRYSVATEETGIDQDENAEIIAKNEEVYALDNGKDTTEEHTPLTGKNTPTKLGPKERPANYLSPFVSVARGKVSLKMEKEKRNSIYMQNSAESHNMHEGNSNRNISPKYTVEIRRTMEAVRYFRQQLQDEIDRLHQLCNTWETYKADNIEEIQNANGEDMINVTIGQTRLLTSKKFMQFKGLIDRCEAGATGIGAVEYDGSEDTKPITSVDLEGFWSMLGLQVDNLDKRFDNLNRWKLNNWNDPDEEKPKVKKNLTKVKKGKAPAVAKAKPNSALQQMMRRMQAEMRKNRNKTENINEYAATPSKVEAKRFSENNTSKNRRGSLNTSNSRRLSIVVKDRKYFSPAATIISVSSPNRRANQTTVSQSSPKIINHLQKFNEALDGMQSSLCLRKSALLNENSKRLSSNSQSSMINIKSNHHVTSLVNDSIKNKENAMQETSFKSPRRSPAPTGRKSILKTPGTAKSKLRNVIFNEKLRVKKFNFLINEGSDPFDADSANNTHEEDLAKNCEEEPQAKESPERTITLRNRKVRLRPSSEIVIPQ